MSNKSKFNTGDSVVRTQHIKDFPLRTEPVKIAKVYNNVVIYFDETGSAPWNSEYFELYQPEQPDVKPQIEPMQPLVSIYDKSLDLRFTHDKLGDISLREYLCETLVDIFYGTGESFEEVTEVAYPVFVTLIKAGYIEGSVTPEGYLREFDFDKSMEFVSKMIAHAFGCTFNGEVNQQVYDKD